MDPEFEHQWRSRFEEFAQLRDDDAGIAGWTCSGLQSRVRRFLGLWKPDAGGGLWLDAGCGAGTYTRILLRDGLDVVGIDYSLPTLKKTMARKLDGAFAVADVRRLPFRGEQFDGALCFGVTQALADSEPALRELARQIKPGGELWIDALNRWCLVHALGVLGRALRGRPRHLRYEAPSRVLRELRRCGFTEVRLHWLPMAPSGSAHLQRLIESRALAWMFRRIPLLGAVCCHGFIVHAAGLIRSGGEGVEASAAIDASTRAAASAR
ncbi:MAG TPA: class I SAM-dependent methyltransferase [Casimicrobiaceae bacterium]|nr:class I SAM-dependent methyltransferase [Casimicrobiaceae bacterium]